MITERTNLLPSVRARSLRRLYFMRLAVVGVSLFVAVVFIHGVLLLPSYLYLKDQVHERMTTLEALAQTLSGSEEQEVNARVSALGEESTYLAELADTPKASAAISAVIMLPRPGITLRGFSFAPGEGGAKMSVSGVATTRESLRSFERALADQPYVTATDLPISAYAKERDIDFVISLTGPFLP